MPAMPNQIPAFWTQSTATCIFALISNSTKGRSSTHLLYSSSIQLASISKSIQLYDVPFQPIHLSMGSRRLLKYFVSNNSHKAFQKLEVNLESYVYSTIFDIPNNLTMCEKNKISHLGSQSAPSSLKQVIKYTNLVNYQ